MTEQEMAFRLSQLEKDLDRQQRDSEKERLALKETCEKLKERVQALETTRTVIVILAAIFGIAGTWGVSALQAAKSSISSLQRDIAVLQPQISDIKEKGMQPIFEAAHIATQQANEMIDRHAASQIGSLVSNARAQLNPQLDHADILNLQRDVHRLNRWTGLVLATADSFADSKSAGDDWVRKVGEEYRQHRSDSD